MAPWDPLLDPLLPILLALSSGHFIKERGERVPGLVHTIYACITLSVKKIPHMCMNTQTKRYMIMY